MKIPIAILALILTLSCTQQSTTQSNTIMTQGTLHTQAVDWLRTANIYEVNVRQYTTQGTFAAFQHHITRLKAMGVQVLWLMPIHPIGITNRKEALGSYYSIKDYKGINPEYGTLQDFKNIITEAHHHGIKVIIDWVANHTSWDHAWVTQHPEYYAKDSTGNLYAPYDWTDVVQLNHNSPTQQAAMIDAMQYWVQETDIDGFRCDMAHLTPLSFWKQARLQCDSIKPLLWLAESQDTPYFEAFDILYGWEWLHKMEDYYKGNTNIAGLDSVITLYNTQVAHNKYRLYFTSNHDENSWQDTEYKRLGSSALAFAAISATLPGVPLIYNGQEEPLLRKLNFFNKDNIGFNSYSLAPLYQALLQLKATNPAMANDSTIQYQRLHTSDDSRIMAYLRTKGSNQVLVIANLSTAPNYTFTINDNRLTGSFANIQNKATNDFTTLKDFQLEAWGYVVYSK